MIRYENTRPGEMIHIDIKTLGRIDRLAIASLASTRCITVSAASDDACRLAYLEPLLSLGREDATGPLNRALAWYEGIGAKVERVMTDNGSAYRTKLLAQAFPTRLRPGARPYPPYAPRTNGKAKRFIHRSLRKWAYAKPCA